jgi:hypothetical protein
VSYLDDSRMMRDKRMDLELVRNRVASGTLARRLIPQTVIELTHSGSLAPSMLWSQNSFVNGVNEREVRHNLSGDSLARSSDWTTAFSELFTKGSRFLGGS